MVHDDVVVTRPAETGLRRVSRADQRRILRAIGALAAEQRPAGATALVGEDAWRIRVGDYRVVYEIDDVVRRVTVTRIGQRGGIYRKRS